TSWECNGALPTQIKDYNNQPTSVSYDNRWRQATITAPDGAVTNFSYPSASNSFTQSEQAMTFNGGNSTADVLTVLDTMGRPQLQQTRQTPGGGNFDTIETCYDQMSRPIFVSAPYTGTAGQTGSCAGAGAATQYDALSRPTLVTNGDNGTTAFNYSLNDVETVVGPAPTGENAKAKQEQFDGLGRLTSVCEETAGTIPWPGGACGQNAAKTGYLTTYAFSGVSGYSGLSQMSVTQNAQSSSTEKRAYLFDWRGRLLSDSNPETGTTAYTYDTESSHCNLSSKGDLEMRLDSAGNATCYARDAAHRVTQISYPSGPNAAATPTKTFAYDSASGLAVSSAPGFPNSNLAGRLVEAYTGPGSAPASVVGFSYDADGRTVYVAQESTHSGGWYTSSESYFPNGAVASLSVPQAPAIAYGLDGEGRPTTVGAGSGQNPVTAASYSALGLAALTLGSGDSDSYSYDSSTGRMNQFKYTIGSQT
ncbi:MAG: hypothetical protein ACRD1L_14380, partial [Terriglobales bacterium]